MNELTAEVRREVSKSANSALRRAGRVPGVLYGRGRDPLAVSVDHKALVKLVREHRASGLVTLTVVDGTESTQQQAIYKEITSSTLKRRINSVDFQALREGEKVHIKVAVVTVGVPKGVTLSGGVLVHTISELDIRVLPANIPEQIEVNVADLEIGDAIHLRDLKLPNFDVLHDLDSIVASVTHVKEEKVAVPAEAAATPEAGAAAAAAPAAPGAAPAKDAKAAAPAKKEEKKK